MSSMKRIYSFALTNKEVMQRIKLTADECIVHLIKIFLYPENDSCNHWKTEVAAFFNRVPKLKSKKKYPDQDFLLENSWLAYEDMFSDLVIQVKGNYGDPEIKVSDDILYRAVESYFLWLTNELSTNGVVTNPAIYNKIDEIYDTVINPITFV